MCGIFGRVSKAIPLNHHVLNQQLDSLIHRGPDDEGLWLHPDGLLALGSRRLAIQDLSQAGHMPMRHPLYPVWIVFNGEIYNFQTLRTQLAKDGHAFHSGSDTEVILAAYLQWGADCVDHLNGMFTFAIYDERETHSAAGTLFLARDRAGEKPLYYHIGDQGFVFASELKAILADPDFPRHIDLSAFNAYLAMGRVPAHMCMVRGIQKLLPGHALLYNSATHEHKIWAYWSIPQPDTTFRDAPELVDQLENLLFESVKQRLVADVGVGVFLSGGLDSSLVTALAARSSSKPVKTYTITFPDHKEVDEAVHARRVAEWFGTDHTELVAEPATIELLPRLMHYYDEPISDSSMFPTYLVSKLTREQVTVALSGDGGDELFCGYDRYRSVLRRQQIVEYVPQPIRSLGVKAMPYMPVGFAGRNFLSGLRKGLAENMVFSANAGLFDPTSRARLVSKPVVDWLAQNPLAPEQHLLGLWANTGSAIEDITRLDFQSYLPDDILVKVDRASMAVSLEVRAPWLDQHIIEFAYKSVPAHLKKDGKILKILPRMLAKKLLPPNLDINRKQGFGIPLRQWLRHDWRAFSHDILHSLDAKLFNKTYVDSLLSDLDKGIDNSPQLFALLSFAVWQDCYGVTLAE